MNNSQLWLYHRSTKKQHFTQSQVFVALFSAPSLSHVCHMLFERSFNVDVRWSPTIQMDKSVSFVVHSVIIGSFSKDDGDGKRTSKKAMGVITKTTILYVHYTFGTFLCRHCTTRMWNFLMGRFMEDVNTGRRISLSLSKLRCSFQEFNSRKFHLHLTFKASWSNRDNVWKNANSF